MYELKPCPFCGYEARISWYDMKLDSYADVEVTYRVQCQKCGIAKTRRAKYFLRTTGDFEDNELAYEGVIRYWNMRADNG